MADRYDGSVRIKAEADTTPAEKQLKKLQEKLVKQTEQVDKQAAAVRKLKEQYDQLSAGKTAPKGVSQIERDLKKAQAEAARLDAEFQKINTMAEFDRQAYGKVDPGREKELSEIAQRLAQADANVDELSRKLEQLRVNPSASEDAKRLEESLRAAKKRLEELQAAAASTKSQISDLSAQTTGGFAKAGTRLKSFAKQLGSGVTGAAKKAGQAAGWLKEKITALGREKGFDKAGKSAQRFSTRLKSIVAGALFFNIISRGLTALTQQIGKYLTANQRFSDALSGIKSNLLTAFQPIYDTVMPALNTLMEGLERVTAQMAAFIAYVFGTTAQQAQENADALYDQANATEEVGKEAKKAEKYLASFDTVERIGKEEAGSGNTVSGPKFDTDFSKVELPQWLKDFWKVFQDSWEQYGATTLQAFRDALSSIGELLSAIGASFMQVWTGGQGLDFLNLIQQGLQVILGIVGDIASAFTAAWNSGTGQAVLDALFYMLNSIWKLIISVGQSFREAWNDGSGVEICNTILDIIRNIFEIVGNLANRIREAWEENNNGVAIWSAILDIVKIVLGFFERITAATLEWTKTLDISPLMNGIRSLLESTAPLIQVIAALVSDFWSNTVLPFLSWVIEDALPVLLSLLSDLFTFLSENPQVLVDLTELVVAFIAAWKLASVISALSKLNFQVVSLTFIFGVFLTLILDIAGAWKDMSGLEKVISVLGLLVTAAAVAAIAVGALQSALTMGVAAIAIAAGITAIVAAVNFATNRANKATASISSGGRSISGYSSTELSSIPHLASGAVISPNSEFLAVLGDQRSGTNIETPLATMKQAFMEAISEMGGVGGETAVNITFDGSLAQLARILEPKISVESARKGPSLVSGGVF
jgi:predicted nuclease with TOPRIM domain